MWAEFYNHISLKINDEQCKSKGATKMNLAKYLLASNSLYRRKVKPRFWWLVAVTVVIILGVVFWDKLGSIVPETFATSNYWRGF